MATTSVLNRVVQKARLGYDNEATVLKRCVYGNSGLTWEADPRHAELAVAEFGLQAARPQTSPGGAKPNAPLDIGELDGQRAGTIFDGQKAVGKATRADFTRLKRIGGYLLKHLHVPCGNSRCNVKRTS